MSGKTNNNPGAAVQPPCGCQSVSTVTNGIVAIKDGELLCALCAIATVDDDGAPTYTVAGELSNDEWYGTFAAGELLASDECVCCGSNLSGRVPTGVVELDALLTTGIPRANLAVFVASNKPGTPSVARPLPIGARCQVLPAYRMGENGEPGGRTGYDAAAGIEVFIVKAASEPGYYDTEDRLGNEYHLHGARLKVQG